MSEKQQPKTYKLLLETALSVQLDSIKELTRQAQGDLEHDQNLADVNVNAIISYGTKQTADNRRAVLFLIDSILRNVGGRYRKLFEGHIVGFLEATYRYGRHIRPDIRKLCNSWKDKQLFTRLKSEVCTAKRSVE